jgi:hypothetical protein
MVLSIIFLEDKHKILLHLSIFYEYQQFFQHRICFSIQPLDYSDPWPRLARSSSFFLIMLFNNKNKFKNLIRTSKFKFSFRGLIIWNMDANILLDYTKNVVFFNLLSIRKNIENILCNSIGWLHEWWWILICPCEWLLFNAKWAICTYIMERTNYILMKCWWCTRPSHCRWVWFV